MVATNSPLSAVAETASDINQGSKANSQVAFLTPMVDLQRQRDGAMATYQARQFAAAVEQFKTISKSTASNANDLYWLGESYFRINRFNEAAQSFEESVNLNPRADNVRVRVVESYLACKQPDIAKEKCAAALNLVTDASARQQLLVLAPYCSNQRPVVHVNRAPNNGKTVGTVEK
jgi:TolA-binding protein